MENNLFWLKTLDLKRWWQPVDCSEFISHHLDPFPIELPKHHRTWLNVMNIWNIWYVQTITWPNLIMGLERPFETEFSLFV